MSLSKKHFKAIANILNKHKEDISEELLNDFMTYFKVENPLFNCDKFREAINTYS